MLLTFVGITIARLTDRVISALIHTLLYLLIFPFDTVMEPVSSHVSEIVSSFLLLSVDRAKQVILVLLRSFVFYSGLAAFLLLFALFLFEKWAVYSSSCSYTNNF